MQELVMEGKPEQFVVKEEYLDFFPRPSYDQYRALELDILENGQLESIKVNKNMVILDGHTRYEILSNKGMMIKYEIINPDDEIKYMVSLNVMRRQLNDYQKIESMYKYYKKLKSISRQKSFKSRYDILNAMKLGAETTAEISESSGHPLRHVQKIVAEYIEDYTVSRSREKQTESYKYKINPRGEAILSKGEPQVVKGVEVFVGKLIGVSSTTMIRGISLIEKADDELKIRLREGRISIGNACFNIGQHGSYKGGKRVVWGKLAIIKCKHCNHEAPKSSYEVVGSGR